MSEIILEVKYNNITVPINRELINLHKYYFVYYCNDSLNKEVILDYFFFKERLRSKYNRSLFFGSLL